MGANARRRHGPVDREPKEGTPLQRRVVQRHYRQGHMGLGFYGSNRELKRRERRRAILSAEEE